jgi:putative endonuclease
MKYKQKLGVWGENLAQNYLLGAGYQVIDKNCRTPFGEIDLVVKNDTTMVFVEVKTRLSMEFGLPEEGITSKKRSHMISAAEAYLQQHADWKGDWRIDVIAIRKTKNNPSPEIIHFENAIS